MTGWLQYNIVMHERALAPRLGRHLYPALVGAQGDDLLSLWWFLRKPFAAGAVADVPTWRLRFRSNGPDTTIGRLLDQLAKQDLIAGWTSVTYEPETAAFGGAAAMDAAHLLFHLDSHALLSPARPALGAKETAVLLCSVLLRAAELDWHEQGDVWDKITVLRGFAKPVGAVTADADRLAAAMGTLLTVDTRALTRPGQPLHGFGAWVDAFERAGQTLADLNRHGRLRQGRGLRGILAKHILFHFNRAGIPGTDQAVLADLATRTVFAPDRTLVSGPATAPTTRKVDEMTTLSHQAPLDAEALRNALVDRLAEQGAVTAPEIGDAFRTVPREAFLPGVPIDRAYFDGPVYTKADGGGTRISAASKPTVVAMMLHQLAAKPGDRVLEIGAGTGYNAALLAHLVGRSGRVVTIDVDDDLVAGARAHLADADVANVEVILGDGALGNPTAAPYQRVIATCSAYDIPAAWLDQLATDGRLVVPTRLRGTASRTIAFERQSDGWASVDSHLSVFMPLRGLGDDARTTIALNPQQDVTLQVHKDQTVNADHMDNVLDSPGTQQWTGVELPPGASFEWMDLWLGLTLDNALMRMTVAAEARQRHGLTPMFGWGAMATTRGQALAYLTMRRTPDGNFEVGVAGHGSGAPDLVHDVARQIHLWNADRREMTATFTLPDGDPGASDPANGRFVLPRPGRPIVVTWQ
ncbi:protein-L-isoaspartate(D-aspartate) O-methyltransferase [Actinomadura pelletieri DSM 43383]|uniref:Protein-L-isoaspartate O-methyltransferase n=1 Tax=Actinomadura pelletieri DSM 43383 TaxID=1120940 RepID=A0A495Q9I3_9ACTN|nr:methyltransferase, FxLD system [Actinomadura pelletieri]RKS68112.1 protein-L-isoaspartate(D-aspartate) O-methyltransferase [Actinomadura pelletieri DSM 43383]